jgi:hypothetical protein
LSLLIVDFIYQSEFIKNVITIIFKIKIIFNNGY